MEKYNRNHFNKAIKLVETLGLSPVELHENVIEFVTADIPFVRLIFVPGNNTKNNLFVSFSILSTVNTSLNIYKLLIDTFPNIKLGDEYYVDLDGHQNFGQDAYTAYESEYEGISLDSEEQKSNESKNSGHILMIPVYLGDFADPSVLEDYKKFKELKGIRW